MDSRYTHPAQQYRCPSCGTTHPPTVLRKVSTEGWVWFFIFLLLCFPLSLIGFAIKTDYRVCGACGIDVGYAIRQQYRASNPSLPLLSGFTAEQKNLAAYIVAGLMLMPFLGMFIGWLIEPSKVQKEPPGTNYNRYMQSQPTPTPWPSPSPKPTRPPRRAVTPKPSPTTTDPVIIETAPTIEPTPAQDDNNR